MENTKLNLLWSFPVKDGLYRGTKEHFRAGIKGHGCLHDINQKN